MINGGSPEGLVRADSRILVVEDDAGIRESVEECLASEGYAVAAVANGAEALEWLAREPAPELLVVDLVMPVMNGAELLERLRGDVRLREVPVVLMTAAMPGVGAPLPRADALLPKPFELEALLDTVARHRRKPAR
jgi:two-component system, chemotaxis family, chemotaxis protein CheY